MGCCPPKHTLVASSVAMINVILFAMGSCGRKSKGAEQQGSPGPHDGIASPPNQHECAGSGASASSAALCVAAPDESPARQHPATKPRDGCCVPPPSSSS